ncbi:MAG: hypothetical protein J6Y01_08200 [Spirochaetales bacterium]|jgi:hypothetical protein|nr:hypothetical protein [Spirochaetales bacterium]
MRITPIEHQKREMEAYEKKLERVQNLDLFKPNGEFLDGVDIQFLTHKKIGNIKDILCYAYEDYYEDTNKAIVLDLTFYDYFDDIDNDHIRILYYDMATVLLDIASMQEFEYFFPNSVRMDWDRYSYSPYELSDERKEEFDDFSCSIKHKVRWYETNPVEEYRDGYGFTETEWRVIEMDKRKRRQ